MQQPLMMIKQSLMTIQQPLIKDVTAVNAYVTAVDSKVTAPDDDPTTAVSTAVLSHQHLCPNNNQYSAGWLTTISRGLFSC